MPTLNEIIMKYRNNQFALKQVENYINSPITTIQEINAVDVVEHRNALFNAFLLVDDYLWEDEVEDESLVWDFSESFWEMSSTKEEMLIKESELTKLLVTLKKDDYLFLNAQTIEGDTPLHVSIRPKIYFIDDIVVNIKNLINNPKVNINLENKNKKTPFFQLLTQNQYQEQLFPTKQQINDLVNAFYKCSDFNINHLNSNGQSILHLIAKTGSKCDFRINFAITSNSNFCQIDNFGDTPYTIALNNNNDDMVKLFEMHRNFDINAPVDEDNNTILHRAVNNHDKKLIRLLLDSNEIDTMIVNRNNELPFKFEIFFLDVKNGLQNNVAQDIIENDLIRFIKSNPNFYFNNYINSEQETLWQFVTTNNLNKTTSYMIDCIAQNLNNNPFINTSDFLINKEFKKESKKLLDALVFTQSEIISSIMKLRNFPGFNEEQKEILMQRIDATLKLAGTDVPKTQKGVIDKETFSKENKLVQILEQINTFQYNKSINDTYGEFIKNVIELKKCINSPLPFCMAIKEFKIQFEKIYENLQQLYVENKFKDLKIYEKYNLNLNFNNYDHDELANLHFQMNNDNFDFVYKQINCNPDTNKIICVIIQQLKQENITEEETICILKKEIFNQIDETLYNIRVKETEKFLEELSVMELAIDNFSLHSMKPIQNQSSTSNVNEEEQLAQIELKRKKISKK